MFDYKEIERTVNDNHLPFQKIGDVDKEILIQRLYDTFVIGNPRALWLSFKYVPYSIDCNMEDPYFCLLDVIDKNIEILWKEFQNVPVDRNGNLKAAWYAFPKGTNKNTVYDWFNRHYSKGLSYLMEEVKNNERDK